MNIIEFANKFPDEDSFREHFRSSREKEGVGFKKCRSTKLVKSGKMRGKQKYKCKECG